MVCSLTACQNDQPVSAAPESKIKPTIVLPDAPTPTPTPHTPGGGHSTINGYNENDVNVELIDGVLPNEYQVKLTWSFDKSVQGKIDIKRTEVFQNQKPITDYLSNSDSSLKSYLDTKPFNNGHEYRYEISQNGKRLGSEKIILIPKDLVFKTGVNQIDQILSSNDLVNNTYKFAGHRVFFEDQAEVETNGKNLNIDVDVITFNQAKLITATKGEARSGDIKIVAKKFVKHSDQQMAKRPVLILNTHSVNGVDGKNGRNGADGNYFDFEYDFHKCRTGKGENGFDGSRSFNAGSVEVIVQDAHPSSQHKPIFVWYANSGIQGLGGQAGRSGSNLYCTNFDDGKCYVVRLCPSFGDPVRGADGVRGEPAENICFNIGNVTVGCHKDMPANGYYDGENIIEISCPHGYDSEKKHQQSKKCQKNYNWNHAFPVNK